MARSRDAVVVASSDDGELQNSSLSSYSSSFRQLGEFVHKNAGKIIFCITIALVTLCTAIKSSKLDSDISSWVEQTPKFESELKHVLNTGNGTSEFLIQTPRNTDTNILTVESFMIHLEAMAIATHVTVDVFDVVWSLKDLCYVPSLPDIEGLPEVIIPCVIKTPLDCFWEGAKLLGPDPPITLPLGLKPKWTNLNPIKLIEGVQRAHAGASFSFATLIDWMRRVGMSTGYQHKPCLDPTDPNCPLTAPNKYTKNPPNIAEQLTGGCYGVAAFEMHWQEEEILSGIKKNASDYIVDAKALQSIIHLMGDQEIYEHYRKDIKVDSIDNWSVAKSKLILETWQRKFKEELDQFVRTSVPSSSYNVYAMTSTSMMNSLSGSSISPYNAQLCFALMTLFTCLALPKFNSIQAQDCDTNSIHKSRFNLGDLSGNITLALITSAYIGLQFIASLGLSSLFDLPINAFTTQILPPIAFFYGFNQLIIVANSFSMNYRKEFHNEFCSRCLDEFGPAIILELLIYSTVLLSITVIPVPATRVFALQTISYMAISTFTSITLYPSILMIFILNGLSNRVIHPTRSQGNLYVKNGKISGVGSCKISRVTPTRKGIQEKEDSESSSDDQFFSKIQNDLRNLQHENMVKDSNPQQFDFSATIKSNGMCTTFMLSSRGSDIKERSMPRQDSLRKSEHVHSKHPNLFKLHQGMDSIVVDLPDIIPQPTNPADTICDQAVQEDVKYQDISCNNKEMESMKEDESLDLFEEIFLEKLPYQIVFSIMTIVCLGLLISYAPKVKFGLELRDIVDRKTEEYEALVAQEKYFPIYNMYAITRGPFDYPGNQRLLYEYYDKMSKANGLISYHEKPRFWLESFKNWLLDLQLRFDIERNQSLIGNGILKAESSDNAKLAYRLLAQTGKIDNPVDQTQVENVRLVDSQGLINQKAFYNYLTAWVINDPFSYSTSEACFKPEPKKMDERRDHLPIEKARPLIYTQIPFLMKLNPEDKLKSITEVRSISRTFEQLNLPNHVIGIPFVFWDQFSHLNFLILTTVALCSVLIFCLIGIVSMSFKISTVVVIMACYTLITLYGFLGLYSIPFNNILGVLFILCLGISVSPLVQILMVFLSLHGTTTERIKNTFKKMYSTHIKGLVLLVIVAFSYFVSQFDFIFRYSQMISFLIFLNAINCLVVLPLFLSVSRIKHQSNLFIVKSKSTLDIPTRKFRKQRGHPRLKSGISLTTISEE